MIKNAPSMLAAESDFSQEGKTFTRMNDGARAFLKKYSDRVTFDAATGALAVPEAQNFHKGPVAAEEIEAIFVFGDERSGLISFTYEFKNSTGKDTQSINIVTQGQVLKVGGSIKNK